jgi:hypothetical protein
MIYHTAATDAVVLVATLQAAGTSNGHTSDGCNAEVTSHDQLDVCCSSTHDSFSSSCW